METVKRVVADLEKSSKEWHRCRESDVLGAGFDSLRLRQLAWDLGQSELKLVSLAVQLEHGPEPEEALEEEYYEEDDAALKKAASELKKREEAATQFGFPEGWEASKGVKQSRGQVAVSIFSRKDGRLFNDLADARAAASEGARDTRAVDLIVKAQCVLATLRGFPEGWQAALSGSDREETSRVAYRSPLGGLYCSRDAARAAKRRTEPTATNELTLRYANAREKAQLEDAIDVAALTLAGNGRIEPRTRFSRSKLRAVPQLEKVLAGVSVKEQEEVEEVPVLLPEKKKQKRRIVVVEDDDVVGQQRLRQCDYAKSKGLCDEGWEGDFDGRGTAFFSSEGHLFTRLSEARKAQRNHPPEVPGALEAEQQEAQDSGLGDAGWRIAVDDAGARAIRSPDGLLFSNLDTALLYANTSEQEPTKKRRRDSGGGSSKKKKKKKKSSKSEEPSVRKSERSRRPTTTPKRTASPKRTTRQSPTTNAVFKLGDEIHARWLGKRDYYPGVISGLGDDGTITVHYNDGDIEPGVKPRHVRHADTKKRRPSASSKQSHALAAPLLAAAAAAAKEEEEEQEIPFGNAPVGSTSSRRRAR